LKLNKLLAGTLAIVLIAGFGTPAFAVPIEQIVNGGFETGDFFGWTVTSSVAGAININDGTFDPPGPGIPRAVITGNFDAVTSQGGPSVNMLNEPFTVPFGITQADVSWNDRILNHASIFSDPNQEVRFEIRDSSGANVLHTIFTTDPGDPLQQVGPNARAFDITAAMQALEGQDVRLCITQQDNLFFFNLHVDDVSLTIDTLLVGGEFLPIETTSLILAGAQSFSWMIPIILSGIGIGLFAVSRKSE